MLQWLYQAIAAGLALLVGAAMLRERNWGRQAGAALVLAVLLLRLFGIK